MAKTEALHAQGALHFHPEDRSRPLIWVARVFRSARPRPGELPNAPAGRHRPSVGRSARPRRSAALARRFIKRTSAFQAQGLPGLVPRKRGPQGRAQARRGRDGLCARPSAPTIRWCCVLRRCSRRFGGALASPCTGAPWSAPCGARKKNGPERPADGPNAASRRTVHRHQLRDLCGGSRSGTVDHYDGPSLGFTLLLASRLDGVAARLGDVPRPAPLRQPHPRLVSRPFRRSSIARWPRSGRRWCCLNQEVTWS